MRALPKMDTLRRSHTSPTLLGRPPASGLISYRKAKGLLPLQQAVHLPPVHYAGCKRPMLRAMAM